MSIATAFEDLAVAAETVPDVRVYRELGSTVDPPGVVIGPPQLTWETPCDGPTAATFTVFVVVGFNDRAFTRLWDLVPAVAAALDGADNAVVRTGSPTAYNSGGDDLAAYDLSVEVAL